MEQKRVGCKIGWLKLKVLTNPHWIDGTELTTRVYASALEVDIP